MEKQVIQLMLLPANLVKCWCLFDKTNQRNPTLEHVHIDSPKEIKYQLGQLDTILFWSELKQNKNTGNLTGEPPEKAQSNGNVIQDLHHPPLDCMLLMKTVLFQPPALHGAPPASLPTGMESQRSIRDSILRLDSLPRKVWERISPTGNKHAPVI